MTVIDLTHDIEPHDVRGAGLALARSAQYLVPGVVLAVVDPGVATPRRAIAVEVGDGESVLVGPDNGLLAPAVAMVGGAGRAVALNNSDYHLPAPGPTFAGRDVFAPAAAYLCTGVDLAELGDLVDPVTLIPGLMPITREEDGAVIAEVLWVDRFGNAQLNVDPDEVASWGDRIGLRFGDTKRTARRAGSYAALKTGRGRARRGFVRTAGRQRRSRLGRHRARSARRRSGHPRTIRRRRGQRRPDPAGESSMRKGTTIALALLLALIFGAAILQFALFAK